MITVKDKKRRVLMKVSELSQLIAAIEGKKKEVNIAQIKEILSCAQKVTKERGYDFYAWLRKVGE